MSILDPFTQPLTSLSLLVAAEEADAKRIRLSQLGWWVDVRRITGSAIPRIWKAVLGITIWATIVAALDILYGRALKLTNNVTPLLSVVVGLILVFRNGTAFNRWDTGRTTFANMTATVRNFTREIWLNVGAFPSEPGRLAADQAMKPTYKPDITEDDKEAKVVALRLLVAFVVASKHHVRGEYGTNYEDLKSLLPPKFNTKSNTNGFGYGAAEADAERGSVFTDSRRMEYARLRYHAMSRSVEEAGETTPMLYPELPSTVDTESGIILSDYLSKPSLPLPLIITHQLGLFLAVAKRKGLLETIGPAGFNSLQNHISQLVSQFTTIERLSRISIPTVYGIHLKQCVTLYLCALPLTLVELMGWKMVPFVTLCAFTLMGIEGIASEIEHPFGFDPSDLPLDLICAELRNEVEHVIARLDCHRVSWL